MENFTVGQNVPLPVGDGKYNAAIQEIHGNKADLLLKDVPIQQLAAWTGGGKTTSPRADRP